MLHSEVYYVANQIDRERTAIFRPRSIQHPVTFGMLELDGLYEPDTLENILEDRGHFEEINRPDIYGYYRDSATGEKEKYYMTLEQCTRYFLRADWLDKYF